MKSIKQQIEDRLSILIGERLNYLGRAANMLDIGFGDDVEHITLRGEKHEVSRFVMHVQTSWRLIKGQEIVLGSYDFYTPRNDLTIDEFYDTEFGNSLFDETSKKMNDSIVDNPIQITGIEANDMGDAVIFMNNEHRLEIFVNASGDVESWRFFRMDDHSEHFVVFD